MDIKYFMIFYAGRIVPDKLYLEIIYRIKMKKKLNLNNPKSFNEKLQWLKLYDRKPEYVKMVDKYEVKNYIAGKIGAEHIISTLGVWDKFEEIDFSTLPDQFVLKCTHDSGGLVICRDKSKLDIDTVRRKINRSLKTNYYYRGREWPYKNVKPRIIAEKYMVNESGNELIDYKIFNGEIKVLQRENDGLIDYKFYCFDGKPELLYISKGLENHATASISFLTMDWRFAPFGRNDYRPFKTLPEKPRHFKDMIEIAEKLSDGFPFIRVDLYEINDEIYFSEFTFSPCSGMMPFDPPECDEKLGLEVRLPFNGQARKHHMKCKR